MEKRDKSVIPFELADEDNYFKYNEKVEEEKEFLFRNKKSFANYHKESIDEFRSSNTGAIRRTSNILEHLRNRTSI